MIKLLFFLQITPPLISDRDRAMVLHIIHVVIILLSILIIHGIFLLHNTYYSDMSVPVLLPSRISRESPAVQFPVPSIEKASNVRVKK